MARATDFNFGANKRSPFAGGKKKAALKAGRTKNRKASSFRSGGGQSGGGR